MSVTASYCSAVSGNSVDIEDRVYQIEGVDILVILQILVFLLAEIKFLNAFILIKSVVITSELSESDHYLLRCNRNVFYE